MREFADTGLAVCSARTELALHSPLALMTPAGTSPEQPGMIHDKAGGSAADPIGVRPPRQRGWPGQVRPSAIAGSARPEGPGMTPPPTEAFTVEINRPRTLGDCPHGYNNEKAKPPSSKRPRMVLRHNSRTVQSEDTPVGTGIIPYGWSERRPKANTPRTCGNQLRDAESKVRRDIHHHDRRVSPAGAGMVRCRFRA